MARKPRTETVPKGDRERTLEEVGTDLSLTRERIRQLENAALAKVKIGLERRGINRDVWLDYLKDLELRP